MLALCVNDKRSKRVPRLANLLKHVSAGARQTPRGDVSQNYRA